MFELLRVSLFSVFVFAVACAWGQSSYQVIAIHNGGSITGTVKWSGPIPRGLDFPISKDQEICDPDSRKTVNLERLVLGPDGGVANTIVFLKNISSGKEVKIPEAR